MFTAKQGTQEFWTHPNGTMEAQRMFAPFLPRPERGAKVNEHRTALRSDENERRLESRIRNMRLEQRNARSNVRSVSPSSGSPCRNRAQSPSRSVNLSLQGKRSGIVRVVAPRSHQS
jgi:hypothetical protein